MSVVKSERLKITVLSSYFPTSARPYGGNSAFHTLRALKRFAEIEVICPLERYPKILAPSRYEPADTAHRPPEFQTTYFTYPAIPILSRPLNGPICARLALPYVRASQPDLILSYWIYPDGFAAVRAGRILGVPVVVGGIGSDIRRRNDPVTVYQVRKTMLEASAVITVSEELRQRAIQLGIPPEKVTTILNGCDTSVFYPGDRHAARRQVGCDPEGELIVYAGNLLETKGLGELVEAFIALSESRPLARLALVGQGPYRGKIERCATLARVQKRVLLPGRCDARGVAEWMRAADVFCLPSYSEGSPNVLAEALACGRPIVATNVGGIPELVDERRGILIPPHDARQLRLALETALSRPWDTAAIAGKFTRSWEEVAADTLAVCRKVKPSLLHA